MKCMIVLCFALMLISNLYGQNVGTQAPDFTHNTLAHGTVSLSEFQGKVVYLFFFGYG
jgi:hypothetical protein